MKKTNEPPTAEPETQKHDQNLRIEFDMQFAYLSIFLKHLALKDVRYLLTHLSLTHEFALTFDAENGLVARELCPDIFPVRKKMTGYQGDTVYFKYISEGYNEARKFIES